MKAKISIILLIFVSIASKGICQTITSISPAYGAAYFSVTIYGTGLSEVTDVKFNGINSICFYAYPTGDTLVALAPLGISTGPLSVITPVDTVYSQDFNVVAGADPSADFAGIDSIPQSYESDWCNTSGGTWGPLKRTDYATPTAPSGVDPGDWQRARVIAGALKWRYLPYQHHHIPDFDATLCPLFDSVAQVGHGLDCSNFTSFVYQYTFNIGISSNISNQYAFSSSGRLLSPGERLLPGDLMYVKWSPTGANVTHVVMYIDPVHRIDEAYANCDIRGWSDAPDVWPYNSWVATRRPLDIINNANSPKGSNDLSDKIFVFPNPATDIIQISFSQSVNDFEVEILNIYGKSILKTSNQSMLNISQLAKGIYLLRITDEKKNAVNRRIVIQ